MRLIDADALIAKICAEFCHARPLSEDDEICGGCHMVAEIAAAPTIDPEELRPKGRWLLRGKGRTGWVECSNCNTVGHPYWKCCPVCESKMECPEAAPLGGRLVNVKFNMEGGEG